MLAVGAACASTRWRPPARCTTGWPRSARALLVARRCRRSRRGDGGRDAAAGRGRHLRQEDQAARGAHRLDASRPPRSTARSAASRPSPGAWFDGRRASAGRCGSRRCSRASRTATGAPGQVLDDRLLIACGSGAVRLLARPARGPRRAGRRRLPARLPPSAGDRSPDAALPARPRIRRRPLQGLPGAGRPADRAGLDRAGGEGASAARRCACRRPAAPTPASMRCGQVVHIDLEQGLAPGGGARRAERPPGPRADRDHRRRRRAGGLPRPVLGQAAALPLPHPQPHGPPGAGAGPRLAREEAARRRRRCTRPRRRWSATTTSPPSATSTARRSRR